MMFNEKLAVAVKNNGKILREFKDTVYVPFGSEYSLLIKNLNSVRAIVKISIDGQPVNDDGFVVYANSSVDIERFIKNGNLDKGNRFKFIERTKNIEDGPRGIQVEDGLIRVEFQFEKLAPKVEETIHHHRHVWHDDWYWHRPRYYCGSPTYGDVWCSNSSSAVRGLIGSASSSVEGAIPMNASYSTAQSAVVGTASVNTVSKAAEVPTVNDAGITVPGSISEQKFVTVDDFPLEEQSHVMVIKLLGENAKGEKVSAPVTVKTKQKCPTCAHVNKATAKFCTECGTGLEVV